MNSTPISSHIETRAEGDRLLLLGASNLTRAFPELVDLARGALQRPLEIVCAKGYGRSFGQSSRFLAKKFPGILRCGLWDDLHIAEPRNTLALITDIGNDLAYNAPVATIASWIAETLDRLGSHHARCVLNDLPMASLRVVGRARYEALRRLLFAFCRLDRAAMLLRAEQLSERLNELAHSREMPIFSAENVWYGVDPIHPRRAYRMAIFRRMLGALVAESNSLTPAPSSRSQRRRLRRFRAAEETWCGFYRATEQPCAPNYDDVSIRLY